MTWTTWHTVAVVLLAACLVAYTQLRTNLSGYMRARAACSDPRATRQGLRAIRRALLIPSVFGWPKQHEKLIVFAQLLVQAGQAERAAQVCERLLQRLKGPGPRAQALLVHADALDSQWRVDEAVGAVEEALQILREGGADPASILFAESKIAGIRGDMRAATELAGRASEVTTQTLMAVQPLLAETAGLSTKLMQLTALGERERALELAASVPDSALDGPFGSALAAALATALVYAGEPAKAQAMTQRISNRSTRDKILMAVALVEGRYEDCLDISEAMAAHCTATPGEPESPIQPLLCLGRLGEARRLLEDRLPAPEQKGPAPQRNTDALAISTYAETLMEMGEAEGGKPWLDRLVAMPPVGAPLMARAYANSARVEQCLGNGNLAAERLAKARKFLERVGDHRREAVGPTMAVGRAELDCGLFHEAAKTLSGVVRDAMDPGTALVARYLYAVALQRSGHESAARDTWREAVEHGPQAHYYMGKARQALEADGPSNPPEPGAPEETA